ncbi:universal stress protein [Mycobacterium hodleri]|uniref:universal stress protein n=1 Tax=Mycolicibacterium hodleri TaxID=49897 RepID=UPI0021F37D1B|nr:universal stress protein [Mycolicibacterium hodleri]MCV7137035.1 universal stress protein [Mycolicibacterium hodleri]
MRELNIPTPSVVVGVDGSRSALATASWGADEAVARGVPLRLVSVVDDTTARDGTAAGRALAAADAAVRLGLASAGSPTTRVRIDLEVLRGRPVHRLLEAGRGATMLCIGSVGAAGAASGRLGSTALGLADGAHCPLAIVRQSRPSSGLHESVVVELDGSSDGDALLRLGIDEALLRHAPLVVISVWQADVTDVHDVRAVAEQNRRIRAQVNRRLACARRQHPELEVVPVAVRGTLLNYFSHHHDSIQLLLIGRRRAHGVAEMIGTASYAALRDSDCAVLVCDQHATH